MDKQETSLLDIHSQNISHDDQKVKKLAKFQMPTAQALFFSVALMHIMYAHTRELRRALFSLLFVLKDCSVINTIVVI